MIAVLVFFLAAGDSPAQPATSRWVYPDADGRLVYTATPAGDRIMDFSHAGYMGGGVALPEVAVVETVRPSGGADDTAAIQKALDRVSTRPLRDGFRGAVLLAPGVFTCTKPLTIAADGVVLRGSGSGLGGDVAAASTIRLAGAPHLAVAMRVPGGRGEPEPAGAVCAAITDAYVPSGAVSFTVADAASLAAGDRIAIRRPVTAAWIKFMHMDDLVRDGRPQTWIRADTWHTAERVITAVEGHRITLDVPLADSYDAKLLSPPGPEVVRLARPVRLRQAGLEHLRIESPPQEFSHNQAHFTALRLDGEDCWARDVLIEETMDSVTTTGRRLTLERVVVRRKARHQGASKPAEFAPNASQVLLDRCGVAGDNIWFVGTGAGVAGPAVILNAVFTGTGGSAESHQRWSTGLLYDNCRATGGGIEMRNRGVMGSGHGWTMGWGVIWNCEARHFLVQDPPGARNWLIGGVGPVTASPRPFDSGPDLAGGTLDSPGAPVAPRSLYLAQLAERLGPQALRNIGYASADPASAFVPNPLAAARPPADTAARRVNLAADRPVLATSVRGDDRRFAAWQALDDDDATWWATADGAANARLELDTEGSVDIDTLEIGEAAGFAGQVKAYRIEGFSGSAWRVLAEGGDIGRLKVHRFPRATVWKLRLTILRAEPFAAIRHLGAYLDPAD